MFSRRTAWESSSNRLASLLAARRASGLRVIDLTVSNPTRCGFTYPGELILRSLSTPEALNYDPDPHGTPTARAAIAQYYASRGLDVRPEDLFITASTSESYSLLFRLICNPGDSVLVPTPAYPLFDYLAEINDVQTEQYRLARGERWTLDLESLRKGMGKSVKAVLAIDPHNPTGAFLTATETREMSSIAASHGAALIVDEVFGEYRFDRVGQPDASGHDAQAASTAPGITFLLNGLSKLSALPQMKIGWIALLGDHKLRAAARSRLEILNDVYLSAAAPQQAALGGLLAAGEAMRPQILSRVTGNYSVLRKAMDGAGGCRVLPCEGGWNAVVKLPGGLGDEDCAAGLLDEAGVYCYPGYFFDFEEDDVIVVSLLPEAAEFAEGVEVAARWVSTVSPGEG